MLFDLENPNLNVVKDFLQESLESYELNKSYKPNDIFMRILIKMVIQAEEQASPGTDDEIQIALFKTTGLEIIKELDQERTANKESFIKAIQPLFDDSLIARSFYASVAWRLRQFRLNEIYEVREVITEAYIRGIKRIESGKLVETPRAWLRTTCLNVIRDLRRKQDKEERPKHDPTLWESGETFFSELMVQEDLKAIALAAQKLTPEEQKLLYARVCKGLAWQQISELISESSGVVVSCGTVRQRGSRALKRLWQHYNSIRDTVKLTDDDDALRGSQADSEVGKEDSSNGDD